MPLPVVDYSVENRLIHLKALWVLGLWQMPEWNEVGKILNIEEEYCSLREIEEILVVKIADALNLPRGADWGYITAYLGLGVDAHFSEVLEAFCNKKLQKTARKQPAAQAPPEIMQTVRKRNYPLEWVSILGSGFGTMAVLNNTLSAPQPTTYFQCVLLGYAMAAVFLTIAGLLTKCGLDLYKESVTIAALRGGALAAGMFTVRHLNAPQLLVAMVTSFVIGQLILWVYSKARP